jgi:hypothetical protein
MTIDGPIDHLPVAPRAYAVPIRRRSKPPHRDDDTDQQLEPSNITVTFDTETTVDERQQTSFGFFQVRDDGRLYDSGLFYDPLSWRG